MAILEHCTPILGLASIYIREGEAVLWYAVQLTFSRSQLQFSSAQLALADENADPRTIRRLQNEVTVYTGQIATVEALSPGHVMAYKVYGGTAATLKTSQAYGSITLGWEQSQIDELNTTIDGMFE